MRLKSLYLVSFSLAFLAKGVTADYSHSRSHQHSQYVDEEEGNFDEGTSFQNDEADAYDDEYLTDAEDSQMPMRSRERQRPSQYSNEPEECHSPFRRVHISLRHNEARGIGYHNGYTTLEAFGIYDQYSEYFMPFLDLRGHVFNNGRLAGNVGIGERTLLPSINHTFGSYLYYDVRNAGHNLVINQLSPGLELVGKRMEYRINGYFPVGKTEGHKYGFKFDKFDGNHILLKSKQFRAMKGGDAEVGVHITQSTHYDLYAAAGPYYLHASHASAWGGRTRLLGRYKEYFSLEFAYSYDHLFHNVFQGSAAITLPLGSKLKRMGKGCPQANDLLLSRASFSPSRFEIPMAKKMHPRQKAINPATHKPWVVWFVNNTSSSKGTFKSPFPTLVQAQNASAPNDMIYVFPGNGATTGMDAGITLQNGQYLYGSGIGQFLPTTKGNFTIPAMSSTIPSITGAGPVVVTVANKNVISGFHINVPGSVPGTVGISNEGALPIVSRVGLTVANNILTGTDISGVIFDGSGRVNIYNNQIVASAAIPTGDAILLRVADGTLMTANVSHNSTNGTRDAIAFAGFGPLNNGAFNLTVKENAISNFTGSGILLNIIPTDSKCRMLKNFINNTRGAQGITALVDGRLIIKNNKIENSSTLITGGIGVRNVSSNLNADISNNSVIMGATAGSLGIDTGTMPGQTACYSINNNIVTNGTTLNPAFQFTIPATGTLNIDSFEDNVGTGLTVNGTGTLNFVPEGTCGN